MLSSNALLCLIPMLFDGLMALKVTSPNEGAAWNLQNANTITWTSVVTDPTSFDIFLVNKNANCSPTGMSQMIKQNVASSEGKYEMSGVAAVKPCGGYQINLVATSAPGGDTHNTGILAQSAPFNVTQAPGAPAPETNSASHPTADPSVAPQNPSSPTPAPSAGSVPPPQSNPSPPGSEVPATASTTFSKQMLITSLLLPASVLCM